MIFQINVNNYRIQILINKKYQSLNSASQQTDLRQVLDCPFESFPDWVKFLFLEVLFLYCEVLKSRLKAFDDDGAFGDDILRLVVKFR